MRNKITYCFDLDGTLCSITENKSYKDALPYTEVIKKVNSLYDEGHTIKIFTARGSTSGIDYHELNVEQLKKWNVKYHELIDKNKPSFDIFIDDRAINAETWRKENNISIEEIKPMNTTSYINEYLREVRVISDLINREHISNIIQAIRLCRSQNGRIFVAGVGGSAANASHAVNDFRKICGIETYSISENVAELTARINDVGWDTCYSEWLRGSHLNSKDILLVFSVGGGNEKTSQNLVRAMQYAHECNATVLSIVSRDGGMAKSLSNTCLIIPVVENSRITPHAEEWQGIILHLVVNAVIS